MRTTNHPDSPAAPTSAASVPERHADDTKLAAPGKPATADGDDARAWVASLNYLHYAWASMMLVAGGITGIFASTRPSTEYRAWLVTGGLTLVGVIGIALGTGLPGRRRPNDG